MIQQEMKVTLRRTLVGLLWLIAAVLLLGQQPAAAQDDPPTATPPPPPGPLQINRVEPTTLLAGKGGVISIFGANFTSGSVVRLVGWGFVDTRFINSGAITASINDSVPAGQYGIEVNDPVTGVRQAPFPLLLLAQTPTPSPEPTLKPGEPSLVVSSFSSIPAVVRAGDEFTVRFTLVNRGERPALGVTAAVDSGGKFASAGGQGAVNVADIGVGRSATVTLQAVAAADAPAGATVFTIALKYRDLEPKNYETKVTITVTVAVKEAGVTQLALDRYAITPENPAPGQAVDVFMVIANIGSETARGAALSFKAENAALLPGLGGSTFALGDISPGETVEISVPMIVNTAAKPGAQPQSIALTSILSDGKTQENAAIITINVAAAGVKAALMLLQSYNADVDPITPGAKFTLKMVLQNAGNDSAENILLTFGTVEKSGGSSGGSGDGSGGTGGGTSSTPSETFAPIGSGGTILVGDIPMGESKTIEQMFMTNGTVASGIYNLPITLIYRRGDGSEGKDTLRAGLIVVALPDLTINVEQPLLETVNVGEPASVALTVVNNGSGTVSMIDAETRVTNGTLMGNATQQLTPLASGEDVTIRADIMALAEGDMTVTVVIRYRDALRQTREILREFRAVAVQPPPLPTFEPVEPTPTPSPTPSQEDTLRRILLGLLGLGN
ncbi:MAG TPA: CARDB domain-containing protein [Aggregatilineales bacterium]|nr:hypothetical protein [Anaerolineales bacterium]HRE48269.1 CARDB domain-containing protein [Aggregatilineales bacterium]